MTLDAPIELWLLDRAKQLQLLHQVESDASRLTAIEIARATAMADQREAALWRAGRTALRLLLEARLGLAVRQKVFQHSPGGRPFLPNHALAFSLSHTGSFLLIGLSAAGRIGIDIETRRTLKMSPVRLQRLIASASGLVSVAGQSTAAQELQAWTRIEAYAKATNPNLAACLTALGIAGHAGAPTTLTGLVDLARSNRAATGVEVCDLIVSENLAGAMAWPLATARLYHQGPIVRSLDELAIRQLVA